MTSETRQRGPDETRIEEVLRAGELTVVARMPFSSNATFLVEACLESRRLPAVYKPARGERPLPDFPSGLHRREIAARLLADQLGWNIVPLTVLREDGPLGEGSVQRLVPHDPDEHSFVLIEDTVNHPQLRRICAFDLLANSADRKAGHVLRDEDGHLWAIDNGLTFHAQFKLRTVLWDFAGEPIEADLLEPIERLAETGPDDDLAKLLDAFERDALVSRARAVAEAAEFPNDPSGRRWPWPPV